MADVTDATFDEEVLKSDVPVLVDFWAPWCAPCRVVSPIIEELAKDYEGRLKVAKVNVDDNQATAAKYNIMSIPSLLIFKNGNVVKTVVGAQGKENLKKGIDEVLSS